MNTESRNIKGALFKNEFVPAKEEVKEYISHVFLKKTKIQCIVFSVAFLLWGLLYVGIPWALIPPLFFFLLVFVVQHLEIKKGMQALIENGKVRRMFYNNTEDTFELDNNTFCYNQISKIVEAKLCLYIFIGKKATAVKKDAFTIGDYESFVAFLREKLKDNPQALRGLK